MTIYKDQELRPKNRALRLEHARSITWEKSTSTTGAPGRNPKRGCPGCGTKPPGTELITGSSDANAYCGAYREGCARRRGDMGPPAGMLLPGPS
eukprot:930381-Pelagomonas_calceolata.AAC.1